jgi:hypothetical protein
VGKLVLAQKDVTLSDGKKVTIQETTGASLLCFSKVGLSDDASFEDAVCRYLEMSTVAIDGLVSDQSKPPAKGAKSEFFAFWANRPQYDVMTTCKEIHVLSYGTAMEVAVTCDNKAKKCKAESKAVVALNELKGTPPDWSVVHTALADGTPVVLRPIGFVAELQAQQDDSMMLRVVSVGDAPFAGAHTVRGAVARELTRLIDRLDGRSGLDFEWKCPECGKTHKVGIFANAEAARSFFGTESA